MTTLDSLFPAADLAAAIEAGHVTRRTHPTLPLSIYTYTRAAQYERAWTAVTTRCRGLVADDTTGEIIAWPFPKFFNVGEHDSGQPYAPPLPDEPFEVYDKVDGSLGIVFHYAGNWRAASKGSFASDQALWAQAWLDRHDTSLLRVGTTYLAEIVYPDNRIVVDYGDRTDLVLLGAYNEDGKELALPWAAEEWEPVGSVVRSWPAMALGYLLKLTEANTRPDGQHVSGTAAEGYVVRFASGVRAKAKLTEYVRLHKVLTGISERDIWRYAGMQLSVGQPPKLVAKALGCPVAEVEALAGGGKGPLDALLEQVPDEFDAWVRSVAARLERESEEFVARMVTEYEAIAHLAADRGEFARAAQRIESPALRAAMFLCLDHRDAGLHAWRAVKPGPSAPFKDDDEG